VDRGISPSDDAVEMPLQLPTVLCCRSTLTQPRTTYLRLDILADQLTVHNLYETIHIEHKFACEPYHSDSLRPPEN
jgi:predicted aconitase